MAESEEEVLLTVQEVAQELRVDQTTVRRWIKNGCLSAISFPKKTGRQRQVHRIRKSILQAVLKEDRVEYH
jgi:excisionase family DNA binding protein